MSSIEEIRIEDAEVVKLQDEYKKNYKPFRKFRPTGDQTTGMGKRFFNLITTQNGMDTDDYAVPPNSKVEKYLGYLNRESKVLILGTGTGREMLVAEAIGLDTWGTTFGSRNIDYGIEYLGLGKDRLLEAPNEILPFPAEFFHCIAGFQVFEHAISPLIFLLEQSRVLKTGGHLILEWPPANETFTMGSNPHHQVCFTPGQAEGLMLKAGFREIELTYDTGEPIPKDEYWKGDQKSMLVIKGKKVYSSENHIRKAREM